LRLKALDFEERKLIFHDSRRHFFCGIAAHHSLRNDQTSRLNPKLWQAQSENGRATQRRDLAATDSDGRA
jgi:hypothetical protein